MTATLTTVREPSPVEALRAHLLMHLDRDYAEFLLQEILDTYADFKPRAKGERVPTIFDEEAARLWAEISDHHTGGKRLKNYWGTFYEMVRNSESANQWRQKGRPANEDRMFLILFLNDYWPLKLPRKTRGSAFQETVKLTCRLVGLKLPADNPKQEHDPVHDIVIKFLAGPSEPNRLKIEDVQSAFHDWKTRHFVQ